MLPNKPRLNLHGKRVFLEQALQHTKSQLSVNAYQNRAMYKFVKMICINKLFHQCARYFYIYHLKIDKAPLNCGDYEIHFGSIDFDNRFNNRIFVLFSQAFKLIQLLKTPCIDFHHAHASNQLEFEKVSKLLKIINENIGDSGKIGFGLGGTNDHRHYQILKRYSTRIYKIRCQPSFLIDDEMLPFPSLEKLTVDHCESSGQIARILRYKTKSLCLFLSSNYFERQNLFKKFEDANDSVKNEVIKKLDLRFNCSDYSEFHEFLFKMIELCPNLKELCLYVYINHKGETKIDEISRNAQKYHERIEILKNQLANIGLTKVFAYLMPTMYIPRNKYNDSWIDPISKMSEFKDWCKTASYYKDDWVHHGLTLRQNSVDNYTFEVNFDVMYDREDGSESDIGSD